MPGAHRDSSVARNKEKEKRRPNASVAAIAAGFLSTVKTTWRETPSAHVEFESIDLIQ
jgi:hypothetical protein